MDEDSILPDDFESLPAEETEAETIEPVEDFEPEQEVEEPTSEATEPEEVAQETPTETTPQMLKLKVDRGEREIPVEEAILLAQKGLNYERAVERAKQEARDAYIAEQGYTWNDKPITTEAEYKQAIAERDLINRHKDLPDEIVQELLESRRDREERKKEKESKEAEATQQKAYNEFFDYFEQVNDRRFDPNKDNLPQEVIEAANAGQPLKYAYMEFHNKQLRNSLKVAKQNESNSKKAPVRGVTSHGGNKSEPMDDFLAGFNSI